MKSQCSITCNVIHYVMFLPLNFVSKYIHIFVYLYVVINYILSWISGLCKMLPRPEAMKSEGYHSFYFPALISLVFHLGGHVMHPGHGSNMEQLKTYQVGL